MKSIHLPAAITVGVLLGLALSRPTEEEELGTLEQEADTLVMTDPGAARAILDKIEAIRADRSRTEADTTRDLYAALVTRAERYLKGDVMTREDGPSLTTALMELAFRFQDELKAPGSLARSSVLTAYANAVDKPAPVASDGTVYAAPQRKGGRLGKLT